MIKESKDLKSSMEPFSLRVRKKTQGCVNSH